MKRFDVGARVVEPTYGLGSVIAVEDAYTRVQFDEHGVKKFLTSMSRLEPSNEPVPAGLRGTKVRKKRAPKKAAAETQPIAEDRSGSPPSREALRRGLAVAARFRRQRASRNASPFQRHRHPFA